MTLLPETSGSDYWMRNEYRFVTLPTRQQIDTDFDSHITAEINELARDGWRVHLLADGSPEYVVRVLLIRERGFRF